jgi:hypothetical protein
MKTGAQVPGHLCCIWHTLTNLFGDDDDDDDDDDDIDDGGENRCI